MSDIRRRNSIVMVINTVAVAINLCSCIKMLEKKYCSLKIKSSIKRNHKENLQQFGKYKKISDKSYFMENIKESRYLLDEAYQQMQQGQFCYAIYDAGIVMRESVKMLLQRKNSYVSEDLLINIKICERMGLFGNDKEFVKRLYEVYHICNSHKRNINKEKYLNYRKVRFTIMQLKDLLNFIEKEMIYF